LASLVEGKEALFTELPRRGVLGNLGVVEAWNRRPGLLSYPDLSIAALSSSMNRGN
jgi:hypothetical protein